MSPLLFFPFEFRKYKWNSPASATSQILQFHYFFRFDINKDCRRLSDLFSTESMVAIWQNFSSQHGRHYNAETQVRLKHEIKTGNTVQIKTGHYNRELKQETLLRLKRRCSLDYTGLYYTQHQLGNCLIWRPYNKLLRLERTTNKKFKPLLPSSKKYRHWRLVFMKICYIKRHISPINLVRN